MTIQEKMADRFRENVEIKSAIECWIWRGYKDRKGYGSTSINSKQLLAHRLSYILFCGDIPEGLCICHHCDNPPCVNPTHLFVGTHADNVADRNAKGRQARGLRSGVHTQPQTVRRGERHLKAKLTEPIVRSIRAEYIPYSRKHGAAAMAARYGVTSQSVNLIISRENWAHVK